MRRSRSDEVRAFYEAEALRGGWSVRQLARQINSQFYERTALSKNMAAMLRKGQKALPEDAVSPEEAIKDPYVLEFLGLKDEYSESALEEALIRHLETFLLELGGDFCFIGRQKRLRVSDAWYRVDLLFFHRRLHCLVIIDLKIGEFTHADAGQMHLYLNYAREHWVREGENPPVGLILCAQKNEAVARYALEGLPNKVMASEYRTVLPYERALAAEIERTRDQLRTSRDLALPPAIKSTPGLSRGIARARRLEVDFMRPLHSQPPDFSRGGLVPSGDFDKSSLRLKARGFHHPRKGTLNGCLRHLLLLNHAYPLGNVLLMTFFSTSRSEWCQHRP